MLAPAAPDDVNLNEAADSKSKPADKIIKDPKGKALRRFRRATSRKSGRGARARSPSFRRIVCAATSKLSHRRARPCATATFPYAVPHANRARRAAARKGSAGAANARGVSYARAGAVARATELFACAQSNAAPPGAAVTKLRNAYAASCIAYVVSLS